MTVSRRPGVVVIGDGIAGLAIAVHLIHHGVPVTVLAPSLHGAASPASAGMLAPSVERTQGTAQAFGDGARDAWDRMARIVDAHGGPDVGLHRRGILSLARSPDDGVRLRSTLRDGDEWLSSDDVAGWNPRLVPCVGAALYTGDGVVDVPAALNAFHTVVRESPAATLLPTRAVKVRLDRASVRVVPESGDELVAESIVVAAGAWASMIDGLPRALPVRPVRGTLLALGGIHLSIPVYAGNSHAYAVPRGDQVLVGATSDDAGFDASPGWDDAERLGAAARELLADADTLPRIATLTGLRPVTPDGLAIVGRDPDYPRLIYACGHSRNGVLQAALTGEVVSALVNGDSPRIDISAFSPERFPGDNHHNRV